MDTEELRQQLACLERRFHRLQCATGMVLLVLAASILMAQTGSSRVVTANEFVLKDEGGVTRARLHFESGFAGLSIYDVANRRRAHLGESVRAGATMEMYGGNDRITTLSTTATGSFLSFSSNSNLSSEVFLSGSYLNAETPGGPFVRRGEPRFNLFSNNKMVSLDTSSPLINVSDAEGFEAHIGSSDLVTSKSGLTSKTSAASLVLFGKENKVLWSAP